MSVYTMKDNREPDEIIKEFFSWLKNTDPEIEKSDVAPASFLTQEFFDKARAAALARQKFLMDNGLYQKNPDMHNDPLISGYEYITIKAAADGDQANKYGEYKSEPGQFTIKKEAIRNKQDSMMWIFQAILSPDKKSTFIGQQISLVIDNNEYPLGVVDEYGIAEKALPAELDFKQLTKVTFTAP